MDPKTKREAEKRIATLATRAGEWHEAAKTPREFFTTRREATHRALIAEHEVARLRALLPTLPE